MAIEFVSMSTAATSGEDLTLNKPAGVVEGDLLVVSLSGISKATTHLVAVPAGWTMLLNHADSSGANSAAVGYRFVQATEPASHIFTAEARVHAGIIVAYRGVDPTTPIDVALAYNRYSSTTTTYVCPDVTTANSNSLVMRMLTLATASYNVTSTPSDVTVRGNSPNVSGCSASVGAYDEPQAVAGAVGTATFNTSSLVRGYAITLVLKQVPPTPATTPFKVWAIDPEWGGYWAPLDVKVRGASAWA